MIKSLEELNKEFQTEYYAKVQESQPTTPVYSRTTTPLTAPNLKTPALPGMEIFSFEPNKARTDERFNWCRNTFVYRRLIFCFVAAFILFLTCAAVPRITGYRFYNIVSESMQSELPNGSLIIVKRVEPSLINTGDNITYRRKDGSAVTHKVVNVIENCGGSVSRGFETKGTENSVPDIHTVLEENVIGVVQAHIEGAGNVLFYIKISCGILIAILTLCLVLVSVRSKSRNESQAFYPEWQAPRQALKKTYST